MITQDKIIECAREAGFDIYQNEEIGWCGYDCTEELTRFANLVAQHQKEKDADIAKSFDRSPSYKAAEAIRSQE